jgi:hypothetical protein
LSRVELRANPPIRDLVKIISNLRERDREEIFATRYTDDPLDIAHSVKMAGDFCWVAYVDDVPVAVIGAMPRWPRVWSAFAFGTDRWDETILALTRHARRFIFPALVNSGAHRIDAVTLGTHTDAHGWLQYLGMKKEFSLDKYGRRGEKFVMYAWTRS